MTFLTPQPAKEVVVLKDVPQEKTMGGLVLPTSKEAKFPEVGVIVAIGKGTPPVPLKVGDKIVYEKYLDNRIPVGADKYNFIRFSKILAVIPKEYTDTQNGSHN